jgi:ATP-dependent Clp protease ATP-binding subunit ClpA
MFERYTERSRRVIFFARYEASQYGSPCIETDHLLLGIFRADSTLTNRVVKGTSIDDVRNQVESHLKRRPSTPTSIDLPLSNESKRVLAYAAEEAERLSHKHIGSGHLLLGLLREEDCFAAKILYNLGVRPETVREELSRPDYDAQKSSFTTGLEVSTVTITSNPTGAEIEVDGKFLGNTPAEVPLLVGERDVRLTKSGFQPWERKLLVLPAAKQNLSVEMLQASE